MQDRRQRIIGQVGHVRRGQEFQVPDVDILQGQFPPGCFIAGLDGRKEPFRAVGREDGVFEEKGNVFIPDDIERLAVGQHGFRQVVCLDRAFPGLDEIGNAVDIAVADPGQRQAADTV